MSQSKATTCAPKRHAKRRIIPCNCPKHNGQAIRKDMWEWCQQNIRLKQLEKEIYMTSAEQRSIEEYQIRRVEYAKAVAARKALKRSLGGNVPDDALPPLPELPRMPRKSCKHKQKEQPDPNNPNADAGDEMQGLHDLLAATDDQEAKVHTSFRKDDDSSLMDLSVAIRVLAGRTISEEQHTLAKQIDDFGPVPQMCAYGSERLNRLLKNASTNRHTGGELEETFANVQMQRQAVVIT
ncbi:hypothetical protein FRC06_005480, partial [Ceratobasidium sp. 370]